MSDFITVDLEVAYDRIYLDQRNFHDLIYNTLEKKVRAKKCQTVINMTFLRLFICNITVYCCSEKRAVLLKGNGNLQIIDKSGWLAGQA